MRKVRKNINRKINKLLNLLRLVLMTILIAFLSFFFVLFFLTKSYEMLTSSATNFFEREVVFENEEDNERKDFIDLVTPNAEEISREYGLKPSIIIAQAALESNWGNSSLAQNSNNYFGIKDAQGDQYKTKEFKENEEIEIDATFKKYGSMEESIIGYAELLTNGTSWNRNLYSEVLAAPDYKTAANAIQTAGYATDPLYAEKLINIIEQYHLYKLD